MAWTLANIRTKVRRLTGRLSSNQLSDAEILDYVNEFYQQTLLAELDLREFNSWWEFNTTVDDEDYTLTAATDYIIGEPIYVKGNEIAFYTDPITFYRDYPQTYNDETLATGDGSTTVFAYTAGDTPIKPGTVVIDDQTETFTASAGVLTGSAGGSGTVNNTTGAISVTFNTAPSNGQKIRIQYEYWETATPAGALWYENELVLRPVPDEVYAVKASKTKIPTAFSADSDTPLFNDWGKVIAYGASIDILNDFEGPEISLRLMPEYRHQLSIINRRNLRLNQGERSVPAF